MPRKELSPEQKNCLLNVLGRKTEETLTREDEYQALEILNNKKPKDCNEVEKTLRRLAQTRAKVKRYEGRKRGEDAPLKKANLSHMSSDEKKRRLQKQKNESAKKNPETRSKWIANNRDRNKNYRLRYYYRNKDKLVRADINGIRRKRIFINKCIIKYIDQELSCISYELINSCFSNRQIPSRWNANTFKNKKERGGRKISNTCMTCMQKNNTQERNCTSVLDLYKMLIAFNQLSEEEKTGEELTKKFQELNEKKYERTKLTVQVKKIKEEKPEIHVPQDLLEQATSSHVDEQQTSTSAESQEHFPEHDKDTDYEDEAESSVMDDTPEPYNPITKPISDDEEELNEPDLNKEISEDQLLNDFLNQCADKSISELSDLPEYFLGEFIKQVVNGEVDIFNENQQKPPALHSIGKFLPSTSFPVSGSESISPSLPTFNQL